MRAVPELAPWAGRLRLHLAGIRHRVTKQPEQALMVYDADVGAIAQFAPQEQQATSE